MAVQYFMYLVWWEQQLWGRQLRQQESQGWWGPERRRSWIWGLLLMKEWLLLIGS